MKNKFSDKLTPEEIAAGVILEIPDGELMVADVSDRNIEKMARGFIMGSQAIGRRREIKAELEERVSKKIGRKGKYLTDKLFELIEGVYVMDKRKDGNIKYYQVPPSLNAIIYALDRVLGKPVARSEVSEEKKGVVLVEHIIRNLAGDRSVDKPIAKSVPDVLELPNEKEMREVQEIIRTESIQQAEEVA